MRYLKPKVLSQPKVPPLQKKCRLVQPPLPPPSLCHCQCFNIALVSIFIRGDLKASQVHILQLYWVDDDITYQQDAKTVGFSNNLEINAVR